MKSKGWDIFLIPELCVLTGITEQQKFDNMRYIWSDLYAQAPTQMSKIRSFFESIKWNEEEYEQLSSKFELNISETPTEMQAYELQFPNIIGKDDSGNKLIYNTEDMDGDFSWVFNQPHKMK